MTILQCTENNNTVKPWAYNVAGTLLNVYEFQLSNNESMTAQINTHVWITACSMPANSKSCQALMLQIIFYQEAEKMISAASMKS